MNKRPGSPRTRGMHELPPMLNDATPLGQFGCGAPRALVDAALDKAVSLGPVDFVIYSGDYERHFLDQLQLDPWDVQSNITTTIIDMLTRKFAGAPLVVIPA
eukprot:scaffold69997_cov29-Prasinocladus_malaysianus.AAC.1